MVANFGM